MAQSQSLRSPRFSHELGVSGTVGATAVLANVLLKQHTDGPWIVAGDAETVPLFWTPKAGAIGEKLTAYPLSKCAAVTVTASGAIAAGAEIASAADGKVRAAVAPDPVIGNNCDQAAADTEVTAVSGGPLYAKKSGGTIVAFGSTTLVAGTKTVSTTAVKTGDKIFLTRLVTGGTVGHLTVGTIVDATSFVIDCAVNTDTSTVAWMIVR